jgi:hypothetical protein
VTEEPQREPQGEEDSLWEAADGEQPDTATRDVLGLAHQAVKNFPELAIRYRRFAGPVAIASTGAVLAAAMAIARRLRRGQSRDEILEELTPEEIENAVQVAERQKRWRRFLWRLRLRKQRPPPGDSP